MKYTSDIAVIKVTMALVMKIRQLGTEETRVWEEAKNEAMKLQLEREMGGLSLLPWLPVYYSSRHVDAVGQYEAHAA